MRDAGIREGLEEVGVRIDADALTFSTVMHRIEDDERVDFFFTVNQWEGEPFNAEPDKCDEIRWVAIDALPLNTVPYVRRALANHLHGLKFDEYDG